MIALRLADLLPFGRFDYDTCKMCMRLSAEGPSDSTLGSGTPQLICLGHRIPWLCTRTTSRQCEENYHLHCEVDEARGLWAGDEDARAHSQDYIPPVGRMGQILQGHPAGNLIHHACANSARSWFAWFGCCKGRERVDSVVNLPKTLKFCCILPHICNDCHRIRLPV